MGKNFYISDLHFGHVNCIAFDSRPFKNIEYHDNELIRRWNDAVGIDDDVYILGDISWYNATKTIEIFEQLNGNKHLIKGNHDSKLLRSKQLQELFVEICDYKEIQFDDGTGIVLSHYPIPCFKNHFYGWYHLYGHVHISFEYNMMKHDKYLMEELYTRPCNMYNVGAMIGYMDYTPRTLEEVIEGAKHEQ